MELKQLLYFISVARNGSFSRASQNLHISQPAISEQISALEKELKVKLFHRHSRGIILTASGNELFREADKAIEILERVKESILKKSTSTLVIRLGLPTTITDAYAVELIKYISNEYADINLKIIEGMTGHLEGWLENGDLDLAVLFDKKINHHDEAFASEPLFLIGKPSKDLANKASINFFEVIDLPIVHSTSSHQLRKWLEQKAMDLGSSLQLVAEIDSLAQIKRLVYEGEGYTILPQSSLLGDWVGDRVHYWNINECQLNMFLVASKAFSRRQELIPTIGILKKAINQLILKKNFSR